jgi:hypothetical protein
MHVSDIWSKFDIHRYKIVFVLIVVLASAERCFAQPQQHPPKRWIQRNNPNYDNRRITYGFLIALHNSIYHVKYSDAFVTQKFDTVYAVNPTWSSGFTLGFIVNLRINDQLDLRVTPQVAFYEQKVRYQYTDETYDEALVENTMVEFPVLVKYKSERRGNIRMYMIGGAKPGIQASGKKEQTKSELEVKSANLNLEAGFGFDLYYPLFKFSPEIRYSHGIMDILGNRTNDFGQPLKQVTTHAVTVYFLFQ